MSHSSNLSIRSTNRSLTSEKAGLDLAVRLNFADVHHQDGFKYNLFAYSCGFVEEEALWILKWGFRSVEAYTKFTKFCHLASMAITSSAEDAL